MNLMLTLEDEVVSELAFDYLRAQALEIERSAALLDKVSREL